MVFMSGGFKEDQLKKISEIDEESLTQSSSINDDGVSRKRLKKGLKPRHIQLIALAAMIGTGLFVGTSASLRTCGPAGLFTAYLIMSLVLYPIMNSLAEMVCFLPDSELGPGGSVPKLVTRYVDPSLGFAAGWNYYYCFIIMLSTELTAGAGVVKFWTNAVPAGAWITIFLVIITILNFTAVKYYGEAEFWFSIIKILTLIGLLILSFVLFWGGGPNHDRLGFRYWKNPGAFSYHITKGNTGCFLDIWTGIIKSSFAFVLGPEMITMSSTESIDARRTISKASVLFIYRVFFFYVLSALAISCIVAFNDKDLTTALKEKKPGAGSSPFVIAIQNAGIKGLSHVINACILTSACSAANAFLFLSSRSLLSMTEDGNAPKIFGKINRFGVPYNAVGFSILFSCISYLNISTNSAKVFAWFSDISTISGFIGWILIGVTYLRFRKAIFYRDLYPRLPLKTMFQPYGTYFYLFLISIICLTSGYATFIPKYWNAPDFIAAYITSPIFLVLWIGHKIYSRTLKHWFYHVEQIDVITGLDEIEEETKRIDAQRVTSKRWEKLPKWLF